MTVTSRSPIASRVLAKLAIAPATATELADLCHGHPHTINKLLIELRAKKVVYVHSWVRTGKAGPASMVVAIGDKPDAPKPKPKKPAQRCAAWRDRGGDSHQIRKLRRQAAKIAKGMTLAGLLLP